VPIGGRALDILIALVTYSPEVVTRQMLAKLVWPDVIVGEATLRVHLTTLRRVLGDGVDGARYIVNVPGRGYSFVASLRTEGGEETAPDGPVGQAARSTLPPVPPHIRGRADTVIELKSLLLSSRFVTVTGPGGIGKTTIALAVAHAASTDFADDAVCFVDLGSLSGPGDVLTVLASALGSVPQAADPELHIQAFLANRPFLIVLDSCEHVIETVATLCERLFLALPMLHLLATSREALRVEGECVHLLAPLLSPTEEVPSAAAALASPAVQLFMERASSSGHRSALTDEEAPIVADICRQLDGIALAIELAAARVGSLGIAGTADLLNNGGALLLQGRRSALPRHQTLHALLDWSFQLLTNEEQITLSRLSVFAGGFGFDAIVAVVKDLGVTRQMVANMVVNLADKSLVSIVAANGSNVYRLLDTTREYAAAKLAEGGQAGAVARHHALYFVDLLRAAAAERSLADGRRVDAYAPHVGNVRNALTWAFSSSGDVSIGIALAICAAPLFVGLSLFVECQSWCQKSLDALRTEDTNLDCELELQEALATASMYTWYNSRDVKSAIERGLTLATKLGKTGHQFRLLGHLSVYHTRSGDFENALAAAKQGAVIAQEIGGPGEHATSEWMLAASHHLSGDQAAALRHCETGFALASAAAPVEFDLFYETRARYAHARSLWLCGFPDAAELVARQTIAEAAKHSRHFSYCVALIYTIPVFLWSGNLAGLADPIDIAIARARQFSLVPFQALGLALKGEFLVQQGDAAAGVTLLREALTAMNLEKFRIATPGAARALAEGLCHCGLPGEGLQVIEEALVRTQEIGQTFMLPELLRVQGEILLSRSPDDAAEAESALTRAMALARDQSALSWELRAALPLANLWRTQGRASDAGVMLAAIVGRFTEGFATRDLVAARALLESLP
jgi:predicted ATPase/DNA-binding winged helix-turn-helix (wHTH) protein